MDKESYQDLINIIIEEYINTPELEKSLTKLSNKYGVDRHTIAKYLKLKGIFVQTISTKFNFNNHIFDSIDTEEKAYWLGFLYADGCVESNSFRLSMSLSYKDFNHLEKFKFFFKLKTPLNIIVDKRFNCKLCRLACRDKHLWEQLNSYGCVPNKSLILKFPDISIFKDKKLIIDFIRGYCDGDGTLGLYSNRVFKLGFVGTRDFLEGVQKYIGISGSIYPASYSKKTKVFCLGYNSLKARRVARLLYENATIYLERKYNIYQEFCRVEEESSTLQSSKIGKSWDGNPEVISEITKGSETP